MLGVLSTKRAAVTAELAESLRLGWPLALANLGQVALSAVALSMLGRVSAVDLGGAGLGHMLYFAVAVVGVGLLSGVDPVLSQAFGAKGQGAIMPLMWHAVLLAVMLSVPLMFCLWLIGQSLEHLGLGAETANATRSYLSARVFALPAHLLFMALRTTLSVAGASRPVFVAVILANAMNVPLCWLLILDPWSLFPSARGLGALGAGVAGAILSWLQVLVLVVAVKGLNLPSGSPASLRHTFWKALAIGLPMALAFLAELGAFSIVNLLIGRLGPTPLAAHQIAMTLASATYVVPLGLGMAGTVRVGQAIGSGQSARLAGGASTLLALGFMLLSASVFWAWPRELGSLLSNQPQVLDQAQAFLLVAAAFQVFDGLQAVLSGVLRGAGDTRFTLLVNLLGHYAVGLPSGVVFAFVLGWGAIGLWWGLFLGIFVVAISLATRWHRVSRVTMQPTA